MSARRALVNGHCLPGLSGLKGGWPAIRGVGSPFLPEVSGLSCCPQGAYISNNRNRRRMCHALSHGRS